MWLTFYTNTDIDVLISLLHEFNNVDFEVELSFDRNQIIFTYDNCTYNVGALSGASLAFTVLNALHTVLLHRQATRD